MAKRPRYVIKEIYTPVELQTDENRRAIKLGFFLAYGLPITPDLKRPIDKSLTWHGQQAAKAAQEKDSCMPPSPQG